MSPRKLRATLFALGIRVRRESGGFALYLQDLRRWARDVDEAFELGLDMAL